MSADPTDEELMLAYGAGDVRAFEQLYSRHRGPLFRHMVRRVRDTALAEELFQDVWQRVIAARERWRPDAKFATWLYQVAHNRIADHWRAKTHRPDAPDDADELAARVPDPETPERSLSAFEERRRLREVNTRARAIGGHGAGRPKTAATPGRAPAGGGGRGGESRRCRRRCR